MDAKEYSAKAVYAVVLLYGITYALRRGTRYEAKGLEWALVTILLVGAAILIPVFFGAIRA